MTAPNESQAPSARLRSHVRCLPEPTPGDRKAVLLRLLACDQAERCEIEPTEQEVKAVARWWRAEYGLLELESFARWLRFSGMDLAAFWRVMRDFALLDKMLERNAERMAARMGDHLGIHTVRAFVKECRA